MHAAPHPLMSTGAALQRFQAAGLAHPGAVVASVVDSYELLRGQKAVEIKHNGFVYRLQTTKLGKLILTK
jgi:hemin uptake protein HemP